MGLFSNAYKDHHELVIFLSNLEMEWNKNKAENAFYEFEVSSPDKDIFLNIKRKNGIRKVIATYSIVMGFVKTCRDEGRAPSNIMPGTFCVECHVTTINYVADDCDLIKNPYAGVKNMVSVALESHARLDDIYPLKVIYQDDKTTIVYWSDKTKTVVKCSDDDTFSKEAGLALAYMKRIMCGNSKMFFHKQLKRHVGNATEKHKEKPVEKSSIISLMGKATELSGVIDKFVSLGESYKVKITPVDEDDGK